MNLFTFMCLKCNFSIPKKIRLFKKYLNLRHFNFGSMAKNYNASLKLSTNLAKY